jgi:hypothetical protein
MDNNKDVVEFLGTTEGAVERLHSTLKGRPQPYASDFIGCVFRAGPAAGKAANQVVVTIGVEIHDYVSDTDSEDMGHFDGGGWPITKYVRLATPEEAAPVLAAHNERETREQLAADVLRARGERFHGAMPPAQILIPQKPGFRCTTTVRVAADGDAVLVEKHGDPDMLDAHYPYVLRIEDAELAERVRAWINLTPHNRPKD